MRISTLAESPFACGRLKIQIFHFFFLVQAWFLCFHLAKTICTHNPLIDVGHIFVLFRNVFVDGWPLLQYFSMEEEYFKIFLDLCHIAVRLQQLVRILNFLFIAKMILIFAAYRKLPVIICTNSKIFLFFVVIVEFYELMVPFILYIITSIWFIKTSQQISYYSLVK